jgi:uncharacterized protein (TIGR00369 family)
MANFNDDGNCFVCGSANPVGLKLRFRAKDEDQEAEADVVFPANLQGWKDTVHGGLLATVLDEAMVKAAAAAGIKCVTVEISVKFKKPVATGVAYTVNGKVLGIQGRIITAESSVKDDSGQVLALATGKLFKLV